MGIKTGDIEFGKYSLKKVEDKDIWLFGSKTTFTLFEIGFLLYDYFPPYFAQHGIDVLDATPQEINTLFRHSSYPYAVVYFFNEIMKQVNIFMGFLIKMAISRVKNPEKLMTYEGGMIPFFKEMLTFNPDDNEHDKQFMETFFINTNIDSNDEIFTTLRRHIFFSTCQARTEEKDGEKVILYRIDVAKIIELLRKHIEDFGYSNFSIMIDNPEEYERMIRKNFPLLDDAENIEEYVMKFMMQCFGNIPFDYIVNYPFNHGVLGKYAERKKWTAKFLKAINQDMKLSNGSAPEARPEEIKEVGLEKETDDDAVKTSIADSFGKNLTWKDFDITFMNIDCVRISASGKSELLTSKQLGLIDKRNGRSNKQWDNLLKMAFNGIFMPDNKIPAKGQIKPLRTHLKRIFGINNNPFRFKNGGYTSVFSLCVDPNLSQQLREEHTGSTGRTDDDE